MDNDKYDQPDRSEQPDAPPFLSAPEFKGTPCPVPMQPVWGGK